MVANHQGCGDQAGLNGSIFAWADPVYDGVKSGEAQTKHKFSGLLLKADIDPRVMSDAFRNVEDACQE